MDQLFPPKPKWTFADIPDLSGKVIIVTGGNAGIGKETVKQLLLHNAKVYLAARNPQKAHDVIEDLREQTKKKAVYLELDLADLKSIKAAAEEFTSKEAELHVLFNNAGAMNVPNDQLTADGYDGTFGTNVLGPFYFTQLLLPILSLTAKSSPPGTVRVVNSTSVGHVFVRTVDLDTLKDTAARRRMSTQTSYYQSKFANIVYTNEFHRRYADRGIVCMSVHPGMIGTDIWKGSAAWLNLSVNVLFLHPVWKGAITQLWGATMPEGATFGGKYLIPWARVGAAKRETNDQELGRKLWELLEEQISLQA
ncbi:Uncharacterized oxidoreductase [Sparassis crispa]|uniref:Uncharacterized oxidoreductase n=1 Tax=Sparassis crispa TaxID=139825 RepID=A0A401GUF8_9APHY|nr:Uncharacterized oxidoreductase [Sparassis crispa]GBE85836.1 Uncharacterized oxidoreductase [Sparassis crispa]